LVAAAGLCDHGSVVSEYGMVRRSRWTVLMLAIISGVVGGPDAGSVTPVSTRVNWLSSAPQMRCTRTRHSIAVRSLTRGSHSAVRTVSPANTNGCSPGTSVERKVRDP
jgi:hypothetical protein